MCVNRDWGQTFHIQLAWDESWFIISKKELAKHCRKHYLGIPWDQIATRNADDPKSLVPSTCIGIGDPRNICALGILLISWPSQKHTILQVATHDAFHHMKGKQVKGLMHATNSPDVKKHERSPNHLRCHAWWDGQCGGWNLFPCWPKIDIQNNEGPMTSIFEGQATKTRPKFQSNQG